MLKLCKMSEQEKKDFQFPLIDNYYFFKENDKLLGFAKINYLESPDIYIFILPESRGNGYGNELFYQVLENIKEYGINSFEIVFPIKNIIMSRIIKKYGGVEETRKKDIVKYTISVS